MGGSEEHEYGQAAIISTLAVTLRLLGEDGDQAALTEKAEALWSTRNIEQFLPA